LPRAAPGFGSERLRSKREAAQEGGVQSATFECVRSADAGRRHAQGPHLSISARLGLDGDRAARPQDDPLHGNADALDGLASRALARARVGHAKTYWEQAPQGTTRPYVTLLDVTETAADLDDWDLEAARVQIDVWTGTYAEKQTIMECRACRAVPGALRTATYSSVPTSQWVRATSLVKATGRPRLQEDRGPDDPSQACLRRQNDRSTHRLGR
jgi:hypothetical protein